MTDSRILANKASGWIGWVAPTIFAAQVYFMGTPQNIATWLMILLNNAVGLAILFRKDKETAEKPYLQMGWFGSSFLVVLAIYFGPNAHTWHWGTVESVSFGACGIALLFRLVKNVAAAMTAYICAVFISTIPIALDYWHQPQPSSIWLWVSTLVACPLAIYGATQRTRSYVTMLVFMIGVNGVMLFLSLPIR